MSTGIVWASGTVLMRWLQQFRLFVPIMHRHTLPWLHWVHESPSPRLIGQSGCSTEVRRRCNSFITFWSSLTASLLQFASLFAPAELNLTVYMDALLSCSMDSLVLRIVSLGMTELLIIFSENNFINSHALIGQCDVFDMRRLMNAFCWTPSIRLEAITMYKTKTSAQRLHMFAMWMDGFNWSRIANCWSGMHSI